MLYVFHNGDLLVRQPVQPIDQRVDLLVGRVDLPLEDGPDLRVGPTGVGLGRQAPVQIEHLLCR